MKVLRKLGPLRSSPAWPSIGLAASRPSPGPRCAPDSTGSTVEATSFLLTSTRQHAGADILEHAPPVLATLLRRDPGASRNLCSPSGLHVALGPSEPGP